MDAFFTQFLAQIPLTANINDNMTLLFKEIGLLAHPFFRYPIKYNTVKTIPLEGGILGELGDQAPPAAAPPAGPAGGAPQPTTKTIDPKHPPAKEPAPPQPSAAKDVAAPPPAQPGAAGQPPVGTLPNLDMAGKTVIEPIKPEDQTFLIFNSTKLDYATIKLLTVALGPSKISCLKYVMTFD